MNPPTWLDSMDVLGDCFCLINLNTFMHPVSGLAFQAADLFFFVMGIFWTFRASVCNIEYELSGESGSNFLNIIILTMC